MRGLTTPGRGLLTAPKPTAGLSGARVAPPRLAMARGTAAFVVTLTVGLAFWFALGGRHVVDSLRYHADRGLEIESLYAGALLLWSTISGTEVPWVFNFKAYHVA